MALVQYGCHLSLVLCWHPYDTTEAPTTPSASEISIKRCPKCVTVKKSGRLSCCARGGAWFQQCGDPGDTEFDHTWYEGIQVCQGFEKSVSTVSVLQDMLRHMDINAYLLDADGARNTTQKQRNTPHAVNAGTGPEDCRGVARVTWCVCVLFIILNIQAQA